MNLDALLAEARACRVCEEFLPLSPNPILQAGTEARLLIVGQAPGARVHSSGVPWQDASGDRLRDWLGIDSERFYDRRQVALLPMGFCYPGKGKSGDLPPRPECAPLWMDKLRALMPNIELTLSIGRYAQHHLLGKRARPTLTETVRHFRDYLLDSLVPLPHPSPRNNIWIRKNPFFETDVLPELRRRVRRALR